MPTKWFNKIFRSVFTKLLAVIILTGICINLVVGGFFIHLRNQFVGPFHKNVVQ